MASSDPANNSRAGMPYTPAGRWFFSKEQLLNTPSVKAGLPVAKEMSYRQQAANFIQDMGQHLRVTQLCINTAIVYTYRFYMFHSYQRFHRNSIALAALFLAAKVEEQPRKLEHVIKMAHICLKGKTAPLETRSEAYHEQAQELVLNENILLQTLGFDVAIDHPHTHVVRCCQLVKASKELAQASYYLATNSLHLTTMCLRYSPTIVACFCIHLACKWSNYKIPLSAQNKEWFSYVDPTATQALLEELTEEFLHIYEQCPSRLKKKIKASTQAAREDELPINHGSSGNDHPHPSHQSSSSAVANQQPHGHHSSMSKHGHATSSSIFDLPMPSMPVLGGGSQSVEKTGHHGPPPAYPHLGSSINKTSGIDVRSRSSNDHHLQKSSMPAFRDKSLQQQHYSQQKMSLHSSHQVQQQHRSNQQLQSSGSSSSGQTSSSRSSSSRHQAHQLMTSMLPPQQLHTQPMTVGSHSKPQPPQQSSSSVRSSLPGGDHQHHSKSSSTSGRHSMPLPFQQQPLIPVPQTPPSMSMPPPAVTRSIFDIDSPVKTHPVEQPSLIPAPSMDNHSMGSYEPMSMLLPMQPQPFVKQPTSKQPPHHKGSFMQPEALRARQEPNNETMLLSTKISKKSSSLFSPQSDTEDFKPNPLILSTVSALPAETSNSMWPDNHQVAKLDQQWQRHQQFQQQQGLGFDPYSQNQKQSVMPPMMPMDFMQMSSVKVEPPPVQHVVVTKQEIQDPTNEPDRKEKRHKEKKKKKDKSKEKDREEEVASINQILNGDNASKKHKHKHKDKKKHKDLERLEMPQATGSGNGHGNYLDFSNTLGLSATAGSVEPLKPIKLKIKAPLPPTPTGGGSQQMMAPIKLSLSGCSGNEFSSQDRKRSRDETEAASGPASKMSRVLGTSVDAESKFLHMMGGNSGSGSSSTASSQIHQQKPAGKKVSSR